jgi:23S rRNA A2030 N6-methylase RlmJ
MNYRHAFMLETSRRAEDVALALCLDRLSQETPYRYIDTHAGGAMTSGDEARSPEWRDGIGIWGPKGDGALGGGARRWLRGSMSFAA